MLPTNYVLKYKYICLCLRLYLRSKSERIDAYRLLDMSGLNSICNDRFMCAFVFSSQTSPS